MVPDSRIHKKLITRLILVWAALSLVIGAAVYFIEIRKIDSYVGRMATEESRGFVKVMQDYLTGPQTGQREQLIQESQRHIQKEHFIAVELYDGNKQKIIEMRHPEGEVIEEKIKKHGLSPFMDKEVHYEKFYGRAGQIYVLILAPLKTENNSIIGYLNGIYKVTAETMAEIRNRIVFSLLQVVLIIFLTTAVIYPIVLILNKGLLRLTTDLSHANIGMLKVLGSAVAKRDSDTNLHNYRVTIYAVRLAESTGIKKEDMQALIKGSFLHDVGKIAISDNILLKPGKLTDEELANMKTHVRHGIDIIGHYAWLKDAADVVLHHHEKFDGTGYGAGLKNTHIPLNARIFAIADVFDALTSERPYKKAFSLIAAMDIMHAGDGSHFDPDLLAVFDTIAEQLHANVSRADGITLEIALDEIVDRYFKTS
ncbi:MAG: HD domain-containing phosphohydrolase [Smithellaceae bacterium]|nr:HD domain-containing phosphohydrolase [Smithellaceae bacterium]